MNWIKKKIKNFKDNSELKKSNWGREFGWFVIFNGEKIGELTDVDWVSMFWFDYTIIAYKGFEQVILDEQNWMQGWFEFQNRHYLQFAKHAYSNGYIRKNGNKNIVSMRALHVTSLEDKANKNI